MSYWDHWRTNASTSFYQRMLLIVYVACLIPLWGPFAVWMYLHPDSASDQRGLGISGLISFVVAYYFSYMAGRYMAVDHQSIRVVTQRALGPLCVALALLPMIGPLFERLATRRQKQNSEHSNETPNGMA